MAHRGSADAVLVPQKALPECSVVGSREILPGVFQSVQCAFDPLPPDLPIAQEVLLGDQVPVDPQDGQERRYSDARSILPRGAVEQEGQTNVRGTGGFHDSVQPTSYRGMTCLIVLGGIGSRNVECIGAEKPGLAVTSAAKVDDRARYPYLRGRLDVIEFASSKEASRWHDTAPGNDAKPFPHVTKVDTARRVVQAHSRAGF